MYPSSQTNNSYPYREQKVQENNSRKQERRQQLKSEPTYQLMHGIVKVFDKYYLDPIMGFFLPGVGDVIASAFALPFLYFAMFRVRSVSLTMAILFNIILDLLVGAIPALGDVCDFFFKANKRNLRLIVGYIEDDPKVRNEVSGRAGCLVFLVVGVALLVWSIYTLVVNHHEEYMRTHPNAW